MDLVTFSRHVYLGCMQIDRDAQCSQDMQVGLVLRFSTSTKQLTHFTRYNSVTLPIGPVSGSRYMARLRATGADWGLDKNNILMMDDNCSFRLMNTRKTRS